MRQDQRIERWLTENMVKFELREVSVDRIDVVTRELQNRPPDQDMTEEAAEYRAAYLRGDDLPPLVLWATTAKERDGRLVPIDGYTRSRALRDIRDKRTTEAYLVTCSERSAKRLALTANVRHGTPVSATYRLQAAAHLIDSGEKQKEVAAALNLPVDRVHQHYALITAERRAHDMRISGWGQLADRTKIEVSRLRNDSAMRALAELAHDAGWGSGAAGSRQRALQEITSEKEQLETIARWRDEIIAKQEDSAAAPPPRSVIRRTVNSFLNPIKKVPAAELVQAATTEDDRLLLGETAKRCIQYHTDVIACLDEAR